MSKNLKRLGIVLLTVVVTIGFSGCKNNGQKAENNKQQVAKQNKKEKVQEKIIKALEGDFSNDKEYKAPRKRKVVRVEDVKNIMELVDGEYKFDKIDTSNWKTYKNEDIGIEMKIPSDWVCVEDKITKLIAADKKYSKVCLNKNVLKDKSMFEAVARENTFFVYVDKKPILDFNVKWDIVDYKDSAKKTNLYIVMVGGAKKLLAVSNEHMIVKTDVKNEEFIFRIDKRTNNSKQIFDGIMQTLKFIN